MKTTLSLTGERITVSVTFECPRSGAALDWPALTTSPTDALPEDRQAEFRSHLCKAALPALLQAHVQVSASPVFAWAQIQKEVMPSIVRAEAA